MANDENKPAKDHKTKMCSLCCPCHLNVKKLMPLVRKPKYICRTCGRVSAKKALLCKPLALD